LRWKKKSFYYDLRKHLRIILISPFDRPAILSYSDQNKSGKRVCISRVLKKFRKRTVSAQHRDGRNTPRWRNRDTMTLGTRGTRHWVLFMNINVLKQLNERRARGFFATHYLLILNLQSAWCHDGRNHSIVMMLRWCIGRLLW